MKTTIKKAAFIAAFGYVSVTALGLGMLKTAQQTRSTLYGGKPVLAQVMHQDLPEQPSAAKITLGGGEWTFFIAAPDLSAAEEKADSLPPTFGKLLLRLLILTDQTAECIIGA